jgi:hypothetical protein
LIKDYKTNTYTEKNEQATDWKITNSGSSPIKKSHIRLYMLWSGRSI